MPSVTELRAECCQPTLPHWMLSLKLMDRAGTASLLHGVPWTL